jgi:hypothetical protein
VPKSIDVGSESGLAQSILIDVALNPSLLISATIDCRRW